MLPSAWMLSAAACPHPEESCVKMPGALPKLVMSGDASYMPTGVTVTGNAALAPTGVWTTTFALDDP
jgi:hypothetical protein